VAVINGTKLRAWNFQLSKPTKIAAAQHKRAFAFAGEPWMLARVVQKASGASVELLDTRLPDFEKKPLGTASLPTSGPNLLTTNADGTVLAVSGFPARILKRSGSTLTELFGGQIPQEGSHFLLNRDGTMLWTGHGVFETKTGNPVCKMNRDGVDFPSTGSGASEWLSASRVLEIALVKAEWQGAPPDALERAFLLWDAHTGERLHTEYAPDANALCVAPDGTRFAEAGADMRIRIRNAETLEVEKEFRAHDGPLTDVAWHPTLPILATASEDLNVRFWDLESGLQLGELHGIASQPEQRPERLVISPDGRLLGVRCSTFGLGFFEPAAFQPKKR
jgi:hypothetical protein